MPAAAAPPLRLKRGTYHPPAPFLKGRGQIVKALEGHPPDLLPRGDPLWTPLVGWGTLPDPWQRGCAPLHSPLRGATL